MAKSTREEWAKRVQRWQGSGLTAAEFAVEVGINPRTLTYWKWRLGKEGARRPDRSAGTKRPGSSPVSFVELPAVADRSASRTGIEVLVGGRYVVRVGAGADVETLDRVIGVLERRG